ncbi:alpha/beta hydrolase family protein [Pseudomonas costantinii]|uniref:Dienelactone hydrolase n=1 Tax=Pseudomonas costantinii TaxID=168469 RepID=A0A1S2UQ93_9PSED|nr:alpha/beta fold hydrolase [Pseudomonas costantinii]NVZ23711.1 alpha/beta fold hydrolase [Pseudomonas costantinii]OIN48385.1 dienelactone hydrolase [Pseudomonas costantinii]SED53407.1 Predicted dienelactone hydrolase [Pseudomonas costantinii]
MKTALRALFLICLATPAFADESLIGFRTATLPDADNNRPLQMVVWYPATTTAKPELIGDDAVFIGPLAVPDAPPASGEHPLVVISHGYGGNWRNQMWLASALAHQGYVVAAVNHPGTTSKDRSPQAAAQLWLRPVDVSRAIDAVLAQPKQFGEVAKQQIAVVGHSLGGWTAMEIAGARFDPDLFTRDCSEHPKLSPCSAYKQMNPASTPAGKAKLAADLSDKRVTAVVSLDLGLSRGMTDASLATLPVPVLVIAAGVPSEELPAQLESADLVKRLPKASTQYVEIADATHFSFMAICKPAAVALIEESSPGDGIICWDGKGARPREVIQQQVVSLITGFLGQSFHK